MMFNFGKLLPFLPVAVFSTAFNYLAWLGNGRLFERDSYGYIAVAKHLANLAPLPDFALTAAEKPPLPATLLAWLAKLGCDVETSGMAVSQGATVLTLLAVYLLALKLFGRPLEAFAAALAAACIPGVYEYGIQIMRDPLYWATAMWTVLFTVCAQSSVRPARRAGYAVAALAFSGMAMGCRYEGVELTVCLAAAALAVLFPYRGRLGVAVAFFAAIAAVAFAFTPLAGVTLNTVAAFLAELADTAFYPLVVLGIPALLLPAGRGGNADSTAFIKALFLFMAAWRLDFTAETLTGRYLLLPLIMLCAILPRGFRFFVLPAERRFGLPRRVGMALMIAAMAGVAVAKECRARGDGKAYLHAAAQVLSSDRGGAAAALFGTNSDCARLAAMAGMDGERLRDFEEAVLEMAKSRAERKYLCAVSSEGEAPEDFPEKFRRFFGVFPFDEAGEFSFRGRTLRLWRFNGRTAFAGLELPEFDLPAPRAVQWRAAEPEFRVADLYGEVPAKAEFRLRKFSSVYKGVCRFTEKPAPGLWRNGTVIFRNRSLYPVAAETLDLNISDSYDGENSILPTAAPDKRRLPAEGAAAEAPLELRFARPITTAGGEVFAENFSQLGFLAGQSSPAVEVELRRPAPANGVRILLLADPYCEEVGLAGELEGRGALLSAARLESGLTGEAPTLPPDGEFDLIVVFAGIYDIYKTPYRLCFQPERTVRAVESLLEELRATHPEVPVIIVPPFAPAAGECRINPNGNGLTCWLYRFALCEAVYAGFPDVSLFCPGLDPAADYAKSGDDYLAPFALNRNGLRKLADDLLALFARLKEEGEEGKR